MMLAPVAKFDLYVSADGCLTGNRGDETEETWPYKIK